MHSNYRNFSPLPFFHPEVKNQHGRFFLWQSLSRGVNFQVGMSALNSPFVIQDTFCFSVKKEVHSNASLLKSIWIMSSFLTFSFAPSSRIDDMIGKNVFIPSGVDTIEPVRSKAAIFAITLALP